MARPTDLTFRHLRFGWWALLIFLSLGSVLELFHAFKVGWYLDVDHEARRLMWRLAHAHGALLAVVHLLFAHTASLVPDPGPRHRWASICLIAATVLLPGGFFLGGVFIYGGDPGLGVLVAPVGAGFFFAAVVLVLTGLPRRKDAGDLVDQDS